MFLSSNIYFKGKLHIKNTKHGLYDEYGNAKIILWKSLINNVTPWAVVVFLAFYELSATFEDDENTNYRTFLLNCSLRKLYSI